MRASVNLRRRGKCTFRQRSTFSTGGRSSSCDPRHTVGVARRPLTLLYLAAVVCVIAFRVHFALPPPTFVVKALGFDQLRGVAGFSPGHFKITRFPPHVQAPEIQGTCPLYPPHRADGIGDTLNQLHIEKYLNLLRLPVFISNRTVFFQIAPQKDLIP